MASLVLSPPTLGQELVRVLGDLEEIMVEFTRTAGPTPPRQVYLGILPYAKTIITVTVTTDVGITMTTKGGS